MDWLYPDVHEALIMNIVQKTLANVMKGLNLAKNGSAWYLRRDETIFVVELQKSNYGPCYFINVAVWLRDLGDTQFPKEHACHIRTRLGELVGDPDWLTQLLDLEHPLSEPERETELSRALTAEMGWLVAVTASIEALRSDDGTRFRDRSLVTGPAQRLIAGTP